MNARVIPFPRKSDSGGERISLKKDPQQILAEELVRIGNSVKRNVGKYLQYSTQNEQNEKTELLAQACRKRIFSSLERVVSLQESFDIDPEAWKNILYKALSIVHKHKDSPRLQQEVEKLFLSYYDDPTATKVDFIRTYMELVARMTPTQSSTPFHG